MKKKILTLILCLCVILPCSLFFVGCKKDQLKGFTTIQSITYYLGDKETTLTSSYRFKYEITTCTAEEYELATNKMSNDFYTYGSINPDGTIKNDDTIDDLINMVGNSYCVVNSNYNYITYSRIKYTDLIISYVNIKLLEDGSFQIKYKKENDSEFTTTQIKTDNYIITYFNEK